MHNKLFGDKGQQASAKEFDQLHQWNCFSPTSVKSMTQQEKRRAMEALMFLTEKQDKTIKGQDTWSAMATNKRMAGKGGLCKSNSCAGEHCADSRDRRS